MWSLIVSYCLETSSTSPKVGAFAEVLQCASNALKWLLFYSTTENSAACSFFCSQVSLLYTTQYMRIIVAQTLCTLTCMDVEPKVKHKMNQSPKHSLQMFTMINKCTFSIVPIRFSFFIIWVFLFSSFFFNFFVFLFCLNCSGAIVKNYSTFWADVVAKIPIYQR